MDRADAVTVFLAVLDAGGLAQAGRQLRRSPPAVTRSLKALEAQVGVRLIERTTRRLRPTEAGARLAEQARRALADLDEALEEAAGSAREVRGRMRIAAPLVFGRRHVAPLVAGFLDAHPAVAVDLVLGDRVVDLLEEGIDAAIRIGHLPDSSAVARRVGAVRRVVAASPAYLASRGEPATPADLARHDTVVFSSAGPAAEWVFAGDVRIRPAARFTVNEAEAAIAAAREGRGLVSALSYQVAPDIAAGRLVRVLRAHEPPPLPVQLLVPSARLPSARLRAFLDFAAPRLAALPVLREG